MPSRTNGNRTTRTGTSLESMMAKFKDSTAKELPILIKADVQGSLEAIVGTLGKLATGSLDALVPAGGLRNPVDLTGAVPTPDRR